MVTEIPKQPGERRTRALHPLRVWMQRNGVRQDALAAQLGVTPSAVSNLLAGRRGVTLDQAMNLSVITGIAVERLCTDRRALRILKLYGERQNHAA